MCSCVIFLHSWRLSETIGIPALRTSYIFIGDIDFVNSFTLNGSQKTSNFFKKKGSFVLFIVLIKFTFLLSIFSISFLTGFVIGPTK